MPHSSFPAPLAELVDAPASGAGARKGIRIRIPWDAFFGKMAERSKALDSKSSKGQLFGGSNPPLSVFFQPTELSLSKFNGNKNEVSEYTRKHVRI